MEKRGIPYETARKFGLGFSGEVPDDHTKVKDRLSIPYLRYPTGRAPVVVDIRFRTLDGGAKYLGLPGSKPRLYNTLDAVRHDDEIVICEGELDALTASAHGVPAVGVPGANVWKPHWTRIFLGYRRVWVFADGDKPGEEFAESVSRLIGSNVRTIRCPDGHDVNSVVCTHGIEWFTERMSPND